MSAAASVKLIEKAYGLHRCAVMGQRICLGGIHWIKGERISNGLAAGLLSGGFFKFGFPAQAFIVPLGGLAMLCAARIDDRANLVKLQSDYRRLSVITKDILVDTPVERIKREWLSDAHESLDNLNRTVDAEWLHRFTKEEAQAVLLDILQATETMREPSAGPIVKALIRDDQDAISCGRHAVLSLNPSIAVNSEKY